MMIEIPDPRVTRFLILSDGRSGTMMLTDTLDTSDKVKMFNLYGINIERPEDYWMSWELFQQQHADTVRWVGTTMHRVSDGWLFRIKDVDPSKFWTTLRDRHDKAILLYRRNKLRQFLSRKVGQALGSYHVSEPRNMQPEPIAIDVQELSDYADGLEELHAKIDHQIPYRMEVSYEQLCYEWDTTFPTIERYLGMEESGQQPVTFRQEQRMLCDAIANLDEVAQWCIANNHFDWIDG